PHTTLEVLREPATRCHYGSREPTLRAQPSRLQVDSSRARIRGRGDSDASLGLRACPVCGAQAWVGRRQSDSAMTTTSLVTGGAGFIGSHVADELLALGHEVVVLDDLSGGFEQNVPAGAEFIEGSILDVHLVDLLFARHHFDYVYHLAAYAAEGLSHFIKRFN